MGIAGTEITHGIRSDRVAKNLPLLPPPSNPMHHCPMGLSAPQDSRGQPLTAASRPPRKRFFPLRLAYQEEGWRMHLAGQDPDDLRNVRDTPDPGLFRLFIVQQ